MTDMEQKTWQEKLTDKFIERIEDAISCTENGLTWEKPFFTCNELPVNGFTKEKYRGGNTMALMMEERTDNRWFTFNQVKELSTITDTPLRVKKGSEGVQIQKVIPMYQTENGVVLKDENGKPKPITDENGKPRIGFKYYYVFNGEDIEGLDPYLEPNNAINPAKEIKTLVEALETRTDLKFQTGSGGAYYSPMTHTVNMPPEHHFKTTELYQDTLLHEIGHSTGKDLERDQKSQFGSQGYAYEELIAELFSSFMSVELKVPHNPSSHDNHAAYLKSWLTALKDDKNYLLKACTAASKATEYTLGHYNEFKHVDVDKEQIAKELASKFYPNNNFKPVSIVQS